MRVTYNASPVFDVRDPNTDETHTIYRCDSCCALLRNDDVAQHFEWHGAVLYHHAPPGTPPA